MARPKKNYTKDELIKMIRQKAITGKSLTLSNHALICLMNECFPPSFTSQPSGTANTSSGANNTQGP